MSKELKKALDAIENLPRTPRPEIPNHKHHILPAAQALYVDQETINAAHPTRNKIKNNYPAWDAALVLVGERHAKHDLVDLVGYLIAKGRATAAVLEQVRNILMDQKQPHLAVRMCDALKVLDSATADVQISSEPRLDKRAQVGNARFGVGVEWSTVIAAAQRHHDYMTTPEKESERIEKAKAFLDVLTSCGQTDAPTSYTDAYILEALNIPGLNVEASFEPRELPLLLMGIRDMLEDAVKS